MKKLITCLLVIMCLIVLDSCSITFEKRRYRPGYHVETLQTRSNDRHDKKENPTLAEQKTEVILSELSLTDQDIQPTETGDKKMEPAVKKKSIPVEQMEVRKKKKRDMDSCDVIFMVDGKRVQARIVEITDEYIHYKLCDDPKGRLFSVKSKTVDNLTLRNGDLYIPPNRVILDKEFERRKSKTLFVLSIISLSVALMAFTFSFFINPFGVIAFILAVLSGIFSFVLVLMDIRPGKYVPSYRTKLTWIFYFIVLVLVIAAMVLSMFI